MTLTRSDQRPARPATTDVPEATAPLFLAMMAGYPLAWALGLGPGIWAFMPLIMIGWLLRQRSIEIPPGFILFGLFLVVMGLSVVQVEGVGRLAVFLMRASWYTGAAITLLYLVNQRRGWATARAIVGALLILWGACVTLGYIAIVAPDLSWAGPAVRLLPGTLANDPFVQDLTSPRLAEVQEFSSVTLGRPAAPFPYTNSWGSTIALLTPFALLAINEPRLRLPRPLVLGVLIASVVPVMVSLNRGAWLTIGFGLLYGVFLVSRRRGSWRLAVGLAIAALVVVVTAVSFGATSQVADQLETRTEDSDATRTSLYSEAWNGAVDSPFLGYGTPTPSVVDPDGPPIGTHGQFWMILYSHGMLGAAMFVGFFVLAWHRTKPTSPVNLWSRVTIAVTLVQMPIYGQLPQQVFITMAAVALPLVLVSPVDQDLTERSKASRPS